jgi:hypothetical protein
MGVVGANKLEIWKYKFRSIFKLGGPFRKGARGSIDCRCCSFLLCTVFI